MGSTFEQIVRKSGNSLVVTIPYNVAKAHGIKNGTALRVSVHLIDDKEDEQ